MPDHVGLGKPAKTRAPRAGNCTQVGLGAHRYDGRIWDELVLAPDQQPALVWDMVLEISLLVSDAVPVESQHASGGVATGLLELWPRAAARIDPVGLGFREIARSVNWQTRASGHRCRDRRIGC